MEEALPVLGGGACLNPGPGGCLDPKVSDTFKGCSRRVTGGHDAVDQGNILLGVTDLWEKKQGQLKGGRNRFWQICAKSSFSLLLTILVVSPNISADLV